MVHEVTVEKSPEKESRRTGMPLGVGGFLGRRAFWRPSLGRVDPKGGGPSGSGKAGERHMSMSGTLLFAAADFTWRRSCLALIDLLSMLPTQLFHNLHAPRVS